MRAQDKVVEEKRLIIEESRHKRKQAWEGGKVEGQNVTYRDLINAHGDEIKGHRDEKRGHLDKLHALKDRQAELEAERQAIIRSIPRNYHNEKDMQQAIKDKQ